MTSQRRFLVVHTDTATGEEFPIERAALDEFGADMVATNARDEDGLIEATRDADALLVNHSLITRRVIENLRCCQVIVRKGVGYDVVDVAAATERGVLVCTLPDIWTDEVANHALALLMACNRRILALDRSLRSGGWRSYKQVRIGQLRDEVLGIVGYGRIGSALARRAVPLGMEIIAYDPYLPQPPPRESGVRMLATLEELLDSSDFVSLHCPLTDETRHLISEPQLRRMKPTSYIVNTARGPIIHQAALTAALREGWIAGAGLDVFEQEPPDPSDPLLALENVVLAPHNGFYSDPSVGRMHLRAAEEVIETLSGRWPRGLLNVELRTQPRGRSAALAPSPA
ncbi:MAG TPA: C-terminal binding protein [Dehalococcoidia bacterium]|nr:C-terminal binding protein [Dehalococcoidia bacterium]